MVTAVIISLCPSVITAGHSFSGNESTANVVDYYIQHSFGMMDGFQCHEKTMYLGSIWGNPIHQKSSQAQKTFWVLPHSLENWQLMEDQDSTLMSLPGLESITARLTNIKTQHPPLEAVEPVSLRGVKHSSLDVCNNGNFLSWAARSGDISAWPMRTLRIKALNTAFSILLAGISNY